MRGGLERFGYSCVIYCTVHCIYVCITGWFIARIGCIHRLDTAWEYLDYKLDLRVYHGTILIREAHSTPFQVNQFKKLYFITYLCTLLVLDPPYLIFEIFYLISDSAVFFILIQLI